MATLFNVVLATDLEQNELQDLKVLCILQDVSIRQFTSNIIRKELKIRQQTIELAKNSMPSKGETLSDFLEKRIPPRGRGGKKPETEKMLDMTLLNGQLYD